MQNILKEKLSSLFLMCLVILFKVSYRSIFMKIFQEFKEFAVKGNVLDMAVGIMIGAAFSKIVSSLVGDIITPTFGIFLDGIHFSNLEFIIKPATKNIPSVTIKYGTFIQTIFDFIIISFSLFIAIKAMNRLKRKQEAEAVKATEPPLPPTSQITQESLLTEIRDILKTKNKEKL